MFCYTFSPERIFLIYTELTTSNFLIDEDFIRHFHICGRWILEKQGVCGIWKGGNVPYSRFHQRICNVPYVTWDHFEITVSEDKIDERTEFLNIDIPPLNNQT